MALALMTNPPFSLRPSAITRHQRLAWLALAIALLGAATLSLQWEWLDTAEQITLDLRYQVRGAARTEANSVIVGVADSSFTIAERAPVEAAREPALAAMAAPWPWDRQAMSPSPWWVPCAWTMAGSWAACAGGPGRSSGGRTRSEVRADPGFPPAGPTGLYFADAY